jgi:chromosomal replication initiation ATPase DnaA
MIPNTTIIAAVGRVFRVGYGDLCGPDRSREIADARKAAAYFLLIDGRLPYEQVARALGRGKPWAIWAVRACEELGASDPAYAAKVATVETILRAAKKEAA